VLIPLILGLISHLPASAIAIENSNNSAPTFSRKIIVFYTKEGEN
jgi:hypothetical protein